MKGWFFLMVLMVLKDGFIRSLLRCHREAVCFCRGDLALKNKDCFSATKHGGSQ